MTGTFTIVTGQHYCRPRYPYIFHGSEMSRVVRFDPSCIYKGLPDGKEPVNKLFGFCELWPSVQCKFSNKAWLGQDLHHYNSARFGWNCDEKGQLWLYGYSYADGSRYTTRIMQVFVEQEIKCKIVLGQKKYFFDVEYPSRIYSRHQTPRGPSGSRAFGYGLFPHFGGSGTSPHKMKISLSRP